MPADAATATSSIRTESITLSFKTEDELELFDAIEAAAKEDERTSSKYVLRFLKSKLITE